MLAAAQPCVLPERAAAGSAQSGAAAGRGAAPRHRAASRRGTLLAGLVLLSVPQAQQVHAAEGLQGAFVTGPQGIQFQDNVVGAGATPASGDLVTTSYIGTFTDGGEKFDASKNFKFAVGTGEAR